MQGNMPIAGDADGDGTEDPITYPGGTGHIIVINGTRTADGSGFVKYRLSFAERITATAEGNNEQVSSKEATGGVSFGRDIYQGEGRATVELLSGEPDAVEVIRISADLNSVDRKSLSDSPVSWNEQESQTTESENKTNEDPLSFIPALLPGIGPLSGSATTVIAAVLALVLLSRLGGQ